MILLDTQFIENNKVEFYFSDSISLRSVLSLILKNYAEYLDKKYVFPTGTWEKLDEAKVVYAVDHNDTILGGICFVLDRILNVGTIFIVFKEGKLYTKEIHKHCMDHFKNVSKKEGMGTVVHCLHRDNTEDIELAEHVNLIPTYYFLTQSLVDNDQE